MKKKWMVLQKGADFTEIGAKFHISKMLARIIRNRDIVGDEAIRRFLFGTLEDMHDAALLPDIDTAVDVIWQAISNGQSIRIVGDYDVDGVCSSYILVAGLRLLGAKCDVHLPDRMKDGYGMNMNIVNKAFEDGINLLITCDNGIAAHDEIAYARSKGMQVVVTDHHEVPFEITDGKKHYILPEALAVVDPKRDDSNYPYSGICGTMVAYKLLQRLWKVKNISVPFLQDAVEFTAFATIEDVMDLLDENRIIVKYGLPRMKDTQNVGLRALIEVCGLNPAKISVYDASFVLGPCVNATGRLDTATRALSLFLQDDYEQAVMIAQELKDLNEERKNMTLLFAQKAMEEVNTDDCVIVVYLPDCHESLAGIVAGRIREAYYRPTIVLTDGEEGIKGSGRSIPEYDMFTELSKVKHLFTKFGGHKMAAGLSMPKENVATLRKLLNDNTTLDSQQLMETAKIDIPMPIAFATLDFAKELSTLEPYGVANPHPMFAQKNVPISDVRLLGKNSNVLKMKAEYTDAEGRIRKVDVISFDNAQNDYEILRSRSSIDLLYTVDINEYNGNVSVQLNMKDWD